MIGVRGRVLTPTASLDDAVVEVEGGRITAVRAAGPDDEMRPAGTILPGLVDLHCHGGGGAAFTTGVADEVAAAARHHLHQGTTSVVGGAVTDAPDRMLAVVEALAAGVEDGHLTAVLVEGPFLAASRCGAQDPRYLVPPDPVLAAELVAAGRGHVRVMTLAPELPGAARVAEVLAENGVIAAVGHTAADADTTRRFLTNTDTGLVTHLFNGMTPVHHREPGAALGALAAAARGSAVLEMIADGVHLADSAVAAVFALVDPDRVVLVSDAMAAAGMADGDYVLGPQHVVIRDGVARLRDAGSIAGGTSRLLDVVRRQVLAGLDEAEVVACASRRPAAVLGLDHEVGSVEVGLRADLVVVDDDWRPQQVMLAGEWLP